jgi:transposase
MAKPLLPDELWEIIRPILPIHTPDPRGGRPRLDDRKALIGILFVLKTGIPWEDFPCEMGCCGMTLWNRLDEWRRAGVWQKLHELLLAKLRAAGEIDFARVVADSASVRAVHGGKKRGRAPWTAGRRAPSTTWRSTPTGCRWRRRSPVPTATT